ncbi:MAG TPA: helix-turn-helix domain-containing protein [Clostridiales bacterium]|nr:helix-turn-helix domain-containing protein [Clostridiales bacterium]
MTETKILYTVKEVSTILHTNTTHVYDLIKAGLLPAIKLGSLKIRHEALMKFIDENENMDLTDPYNIKPISAE